MAVLADAILLVMAVYTRAIECVRTIVILIARMDARADAWALAAEVAQV